MPQRNVATNFTFEQQRLEINQLAQDFWTQKGTVDNAASTYLKHDGSNNFTGGTLAVPNAFTINSNSGGGTVTIAGNLQVDGTTTTVNTATMDVVDKNITIAKGSANDAAADGAGITIDSGTDITWNFVDANDAWVSSIGVEATTFLKGPYGQFTGSGTPTTGHGVQINAPDENTGQISSYDNNNTAYKELRVKGSSVGFYTGTSNAIVGTFNSTGLSMESNKTINSGNITISTNTDASFFVNTTNVNGSHLRLQTSGTTKTYLGQASGISGSLGNANDFAIRSAEDIVFSTNNNNTPNVKIDTSGHVGIGDSNPAQLLSLKSADPRILLTETTNNSNCYLDYAAGGILEISVDDNNVDASSKFQVRIDGATAGLTLDSTGLDVTGAIACGSSIGINGSGGTQYPLHVYSGQKYLVGLKNTSVNSGIGYPWINHDSTAGGQSSLVVHFNGIGDRFFVRENGTAESTGAFTSTQLIATQGATTEFIQAVSTNNGTRAVGSFEGKDSSGNAVTLKMGGYGDTNRGEIFTHSNHALGFATNNAATQMVLDTGGRLIIGNTSDLAPDGFGSKIQVNAANHEGSIQIGRHTANSNGPILIFNKTRSGTAAPGSAALSRDDMLGGMRFFGSDGTDYNCNGGGIQAYMDGDASNNNFPGRLEFLTTTGGSPQGSVKMTISENGAIVTPLGSPLSYHATNATYEIYNDDHEIAISDSTSGWHVMKQWTATKSGQFFIKFQGKIDSGPYYWAGDVYNQTQGKRINQNGTAPNSEALNGLKAFRFADLLDTNDTSAGNAVHEFRRHKLKCGNNSGSYVGEVKPGDIIQLRMASAGNNGTLVTGSGQNLRCQNFRIYSDTPGRETGGKEFNPNNAAFHAIMDGGAIAFNQGDDLTWGSTSFNRGYVTDSNNATVEYGFDVANNCFRVPHTGIYHFYCNFFINSASNCRVSIEVDGTAYTSGYIWGCNVDEGQATANQAGAQSLYLGKGSVVKLTVQSGAIGNTYGGHTSWGGFLVG